jgi:hypothetical protein
MTADRKIVGYSLLVTLLGLAFLAVQQNLELAGLQAQPAPAPIIMSPVKEIGDGLPQIDGGSKEEPTTWPATLKYYAGGKFACTSTIVGDRVVVTAAHCLFDGVPLQIGFDNQTTAHLRCDRHPSYDVNGYFADVALCVSDTAFSRQFLYENLDLSVTHVRSQTDLYLLGYGCRDVRDTQNLAKTGQLYGGKSTVTFMSRLPGGHYLAEDGVVICPGDSGGAAYLLKDMNKRAGPRSIVGINSEYSAVGRSSSITGLTDTVATFVRDWSSDAKVAICGVQPEANNCHDRFVP